MKSFKWLVLVVHQLESARFKLAFQPILSVVSSRAGTQLFQVAALGLTLVVLITGIFGTARAQGGDVNRGKQLYNANCVVCHGDRAQGRVGPTLSKDFPGIRVDLLLKEIISNGVPNTVMPTWSKAKGGPLADSEIDDLVAYIQSLGHQAPTVPAPTGPTATRPPLPSPIATFPAGDSTRGGAIFAQDCVVCHGERGEGRIGASLQKDFPGINVEAFLDATIARGVAGSKMPAWAQSNGGPLTNQQIADVAAFIRTLKPARQQVTPTPVAQASPVAGPFALICIGLVIVVGVVVLAIGIPRMMRRTPPKNP